MDLNNKIAIVTGGGSGIGFEYVKLLVAKNCSVVIADLRLTDAAEEFISQPYEGTSAKMRFKKTDVTIWKELEDLFSYTEQELGAPDIVSPTAGIFEPSWSHFWNDTETQGYKTIQVNCEHPVKLTRLAIRSFLRAQKPGVVMHVSSIAGQLYGPNTPIYCASKAFVSHFVRGFGVLQEKENIRVVGVAPGLVNTPLWHQENPEKLRELNSRLPNTDAWIEPVDVATEMLDLTESWSIPGGSIVEVVSKGSRRVVKVFNDPGPIFWKQGGNPAMESEVLRMVEKEKGIP